MQKDTLHQIVSKEKEIIVAIQNNDEHVLKTIYQNNYSKVEQFILKNKGRKQQAKDIYQEAFIIVWKNVKNNKFIPKNDTAINGYLYTIAKNKWMDYLRSAEYKKKTSLNEVKHGIGSSIEINDRNFADGNEKKLNKVIETFKTLGKPCKELLTTFYFDKKSIKEIAKELNLEEASARNKKYRCMQKLRGLVLAST